MVTRYRHPTGTHPGGLIGAADSGASTAGSDGAALGIGKLPDSTRYRQGANADLQEAERCCGYGYSPRNRIRGGAERAGR